MANNRYIIERYNTVIDGYEFLQDDDDLVHAMLLVKRARELKPMKSKLRIVEVLVEYN